MINYYEPIFILNCTKNKTINDEMYDVLCRRMYGTIGTCMLLLSNIQVPIVKRNCNIILLSTI